jgi:tetratricopeptide (TPR) repeat protein
LYLLQKLTVKQVKEFQLSIAHFKEGKFEDALSQINYCIKEDGNNTEYYFFRARVFSRLGDFDSALADFNKLIDLDPYNPSYINDRAVVLHLMKNDEEALAEFDRAINLDPKNPYHFSSRAYFRDRIGDLKGAIEDYERAIELDPEDAVAYNNKGLLEEKLGYQERAKSSFSKADDLIGYSPNKNTEPIPSQRKDSVHDTKVTQREEESKKVTVKDYFMVMKKILTNPSTRHEFFGFIKSKFNNEPK